MIQKDNLTIIYALLGMAALSFGFGFWPAFEKIVLRWNNGDNNYCYLIIPLFFYLVWDQKYNGRNGFQYGKFSWSFWGLIIIIIALSFMLLGEAGAVETFLYGGIWLVVVGLAVLLYGWRAKHLTFPLFILMFMVPIPPFINNILTFKLKLIATSLAVKMMRLVDISVLQTGNMIDLGTDQIQVVDACSGLRYFVPMFLIALLVGRFFNKGFWRRLLLLLIVPPLSIAVNAFRIFLSGWLTVNGHKELAQNFFHNLSGWMVFMIAGTILIGISVGIKRIGQLPERKPLVDRPQSDIRPRSAPVFLSGALCLIFIISGIVFRVSPSSANLPDRRSFQSFPMQIDDWQGRRQFLSKEILAQLWADDYISVLYQKPSSPNRIQVLIPFYAYQGTRHTAHAPQSCLLGGGFDLLKSEDRIIPVDTTTNIKVRALLLKQGRTRILATYFFYQRGRVFTSPWMNKFYLMWDALTRHRTDGALVRVELHLVPNQSEEDGFAVLSEFLTKIWYLLPVYIPS